MKQAGLAGESLEAIAASVTTINDMNTQIASAAEEQSSVAGELNRNITNIHQVAEESEQQAGSIRSACNELARMGEQLQHLVGRFKV